MFKSKTTSITLGEHFEEIIKTSIESGRYASASEVVRAGLRLIDRKEQKLKILNEAIEAGERSGYVENFDPVELLAALRLRSGTIMMKKRYLSATPPSTTLRNHY